MSAAAGAADGGKAKKRKAANPSEETESLADEANMPIEELLARYKRGEIEHDDDSESSGATSDEGASDSSSSSSGSGSSSSGSSSGSSSSGSSSSESEGDKKKKTGEKAKSGKAEKGGKKRSAPESDTKDAAKGAADPKKAKVSEEKKA
jgi:hypothetical protein